ncbi:MAG: hypothetical protein WBF67_00670, partial [Olleya sp.]
MNNFLKSFLFFLLICFAQKGFAQYEKIPLDSLDLEERARTFAFAFKLFSAKNLNEIPRVNNNTASSYFLRKYEALTFKQIGNDWHLERFGEIKKMKLEEVLLDSKMNHIYRYKVFHTETDLLGEIR